MIFSTFGGFLLIETDRFSLRQLNTETDDFSHYLSWMHDAISNPFILSIDPKLTEIDLKGYVTEKNIQPDCLLLGIFAKSDGTHIGNLKFEPLDYKNGIAWLGILIGNEIWRGVHAAREVLSVSLDQVSRELQIHTFRLGVSQKNTPAIRSYSSCGFKEVHLNPSNELKEVLTMQKIVSN